MDLVSQMSDLLNSLYSGFESGDAAVWADSLAPDVLVIGTDTAEWWQGQERVSSVLHAQMSEMHEAGIRLERRGPLIAADGATVWAADQPTMHLPDGSEVPLRLTILATREGDHLTIRQMHLSLGSPNEDVLSQTLTI